MNSIIQTNIIPGRYASTSFWAVSSASTTPANTAMVVSADIWNRPSDIAFFVEGFEPPREEPSETASSSLLRNDLAFTVRKRLLETAANMESKGLSLLLRGLAEPSSVQTESATTSSIGTAYRFQEAKRLVASGRVREARRSLLSITLSARPGREIEKWITLIAEPKVVLSGKASGTNVKANANWLRMNSAEHRGSWVALKDGRLLGSHKHRGELHRSLKIEGMLQGTVFFKID